VGPNDYFSLVFPVIDMLFSAGRSALVTFTLIQNTLAAVEPITSLNIVNKVIAPDGFPRSYVTHNTPNFTNRFSRTVLADGKFPGPLIKGNKVFSSFHVIPIATQLHYLGRQVQNQCVRWFT
jgi:hypothetical protein